MPLAISITSIEASGNALRVGFNVTPSGNYTTGIGGDTLNFTTATQDPVFEGPAASIPSSLAPIELNVWSQSGQTTYEYRPVVGATPATCAMLVLTAYNTEHGTGAYEAAILADSIHGTAVFKKGV
jgi:hypothetical protein